jgi:hypothetical protein
MNTRSQLYNNLMYPEIATELNFNVPRSRKGSDTLCWFRHLKELNIHLPNTEKYYFVKSKSLLKFQWSC